MDVLDILNDDGGLKPIREWPKIWRTTLSGFDLSSTIMNMDETTIETILKNKMARQGEEPRADW